MCPKGEYIRQWVRGWGVPIRTTGEKAYQSVYSVEEGEEQEEADYYLHSVRMEKEAGADSLAGHLGTAHSLQALLKPAY